MSATTEVFAEIAATHKLQQEGRLLAGLGVYYWDRKRGMDTAARATVRLRELYAGLDMDDMVRLQAYLAEENAR